MAKRICFVLLLLASALFWPFWVTAILALFGIIYFPKFFEAVVILFVSDLLFATPEARFGGIILISTGLALVTLLGLEYLKKKLKFYPTS